MNKYVLIAVLGTQSIGMLCAMNIDYQQIGNALKQAYPLVREEVSNIRNTIGTITNKLEQSGITEDQVNNLVNTFGSLASAINSQDPDAKQIRDLTEQARSQLRSLVGKLDIQNYADSAQKLFNNIQSLVTKLLDAYNVVSRVLAVLPADAVSALNNMQNNIKNLADNATQVVNALQADPNFKKLIQTAEQAVTK